VVVAGSSPARLTNKKETPFRGFFFIFARLVWTRTKKEVLGEKSIFSPIGALEHLRGRKRNIKEKPSGFFLKELLPNKTCWLVSLLVAVRQKRCESPARLTFIAVDKYG
jgi:hypothetical protein